MTTSSPPSLSDFAVGDRVTVVEPVWRSEPGGELYPAAEALRGAVGIVALITEQPPYIYVQLDEIVAPSEFGEVFAPEALELVTPTAPATPEESA